jgi:hypothetical protein
MVLKKLFRQKEHATRILDKNHIANKYRHKYLEDMKKEERRQMTLNLRQLKIYKEDHDDEMGE